MEFTRQDNLNTIKNSPFNSEYKKGLAILQDTITIANIQKQQIQAKLIEAGIDLDSRDEAFLREEIKKQPLEIKNLIKSHTDINRSINNIIAYLSQVDDTVADKKPGIFSILSNFTNKRNKESLQLPLIRDLRTNLIREINLASTNTEKAAKISPHAAVINVAHNIAQRREATGVPPKTAEQREAELIATTDPAIMAIITQLREEKAALSSRLDALEAKVSTIPAPEPTPAPAATTRIASVTDQIDFSPTKKIPIYNPTRDKTKDEEFRYASDKTVDAKGKASNSIQTDSVNRMILLQAETRLLNFDQIENRPFQLLLSFQDYQSVKMDLIKKIRSEESQLSNLNEGEIKTQVLTRITDYLYQIDIINKEQDEIKLYIDKLSPQEKSKFTEILTQYTTETDLREVDYRGRETITKKSRGYLESEAAIKELKARFTTPTTVTEVTSDANVEAPLIITPIPVAEPAPTPAITIPSVADSNYQQLNIDFDSPATISEPTTVTIANLDGLTSPATEPETPIDNPTITPDTSNDTTPFGQDPTPLVAAIGSAVAAPKLRTPSNIPAPVKSEKRVIPSPTSVPRSTVERPQRPSSPWLKPMAKLIGPAVIGGQGGLKYNSEEGIFASDNRETENKEYLQKLNEFLTSDKGEEYKSSDKFTAILTLINSYNVKTQKNEYGYNYTSFVLDEANNSITFTLEPIKDLKEEVGYSKKEVTISNLTPEQLKVINSLGSVNNEDWNTKANLIKLLNNYLNQESADDIVGKELKSQFQELNSFLIDNNFALISQEIQIIKPNGDLDLQFKDLNAIISTITIKSAALQQAGLDASILIKKISELQSITRNYRPLPPNLLISTKYVKDELSELKIEIPTKSYPLEPISLTLNNDLVDLEIMNKLRTLDKDFKAILDKDTLNILRYRLIESQAPELLSSFYVPNEKSPDSKSAIERKERLDEIFKEFTDLDLFGSSFKFIGDSQIKSDLDTIPKGYSKESLAEHNLKIEQFLKSIQENKGLVNAIQNFTKKAITGKYEQALKPKRDFVANELAKLTSYLILKNLTDSDNQAIFESVDSKILYSMSIMRPRNISTNEFISFINQILQEQLKVEYPGIQQCTDFTEGDLNGVKDIPIEVDNQTFKFSDFVDALNSKLSSGVLDKELVMIKDCFEKVMSVASNEDYKTNRTAMVSKTLKSQLNKHSSLGLVLSSTSS
jgi:hypothetical protein